MVRRQASAARTRREKKRSTYRSWRKAVTTSPGSRTAKTDTSFHTQARTVTNEEHPNHDPKTPRRLRRPVDTRILAKRIAYAPVSLQSKTTACAIDSVTPLPAIESRGLPKSPWIRVCAGMTSQSDARKALQETVEMGFSPCGLNQHGLKFILPTPQVQRPCVLCIERPTSSSGSLSEPRSQKGSRRPADNHDRTPVPGCLDCCRPA